MGQLDIYFLFGPSVPFSSVISFPHSSVFSILFALELLIVFRHFFSIYSSDYNIPVRLLLLSLSRDSLQSHGLHHARLPCPSPSPGVCSNSRSLSRWCRPTISSLVVPFSSCPQSFPSWASFSVSPPFASSGQRIGVSASVLAMNSQGWFPLRLTVNFFFNAIFHTREETHNSKIAFTFFKLFLVPSWNRLLQCHNSHSVFDFV